MEDFYSRTGLLYTVTRWYLGPADMSCVMVAGRAMATQDLRRRRAHLLYMEESQWRQAVLRYRRICTYYAIMAQAAEVEMDVYVMLRMDLDYHDYQNNTHRDDDPPFESLPVWFGSYIW